MSGRIPLRRTGLLVFGSRIVSIFTGMLFLIMVTGWLDAPHFGLWEVILTAVALFSYPAGFLGYWGTREIARGRMLGRTVVLFNLGLSVLAAAAYLVFSLFSHSVFDSSATPFILAALLVPLAYWNQAANSIASGHRPTAFGWAILVSEPGKLVVAYVALFVFKLGIYGVIAAMIASYVLQGVVTTVLVAGTLGEKTDPKAARSWAKYSWVPAIIALSPTLASVDTVIASALGSTNLAGHYQAAFQIGTLVSYVAFLSYALYPLLLKGASDEVPNATLELILMFGVPMTVGVVALAPHLLTMLSPVYVASGGDVTVPLALLGLAGLVGAISGFLDNTLTGRERSDLNLESGLKTYAKTSFAFVSMANLVYAASYIVLVTAEIYLGGSMGLSISSVVTGWALLQVVLLGILVAFKSRRVLRSVGLVLPRSLPKFILCSLLMAAIVVLLGNVVLTNNPSRFIYGLKIVAVVVVGGASYFVALTAVDTRTRGLAQSFLKLVRPTKQV